MQTECNAESIDFGVSGRRSIVATFDGGTLSSDGGSLLLRSVEERIGLVRRFAACFRDFRDSKSVEHSVESLVAQRVFGLALGYEDLNDHDSLRSDPLFATAIGRVDPTGLTRARNRDRGKALAGKSTLNRLELASPVPADGERYKKVALEFDSVDRLFVDAFLDSRATAPDEIIIDLDATDDPIHGRQEGRFFHGYYGGYCYLPLYIFVGEDLLCARLRTANQDGSAGSLEELQRIVPQIRSRWPKTSILTRADSGFARDAIMSWCEANSVDYVFGLARNPRLENLIQADLEAARLESETAGKPVRSFRELRYRTLDSWSCERRVVAKAEHIPGKSNPRFIVTSLAPSRVVAAELYERIYCARGDMENRIKEQQLCLFADRTSGATLRANQIRLWFSSIAYMLLVHLRRIGLAGTELAHARCDTIRLKLLKIGAQVRISVRRIVVALASSHPAGSLFRTVHARLIAVPT